MSGSDIISAMINPKSYSSLLYRLKNYGIKDTIIYCKDYALRSFDVVRFKNAKKIKIPDINRIPTEKLSLKVNEEPLVSIIIPVYNNYSLTYNCIKSVIGHKCITKYEIIVVDDCSTDATKSISEQISGIRVIRNESNLGFLRNCNKAAFTSKSRYILLLNNDTSVCDGWLDSLVKTIESDQSVGIVGSKMLFPDGSLQEAGGIIWSDGSGWNYGREMSPFRCQFNYVRDVDYISGASILIRNDLFKKFGGFDERYVPAYCEDSDFAMTMRIHGYRVVYQPRSVLYHFEGMSNGKMTISGLKQYQVINNDKFKEKWAKELNDGHCKDESLLFYARDRSKEKKVILFIDDNIPKFDDNAGNRTVYDYMRCMVNLGMNVKILTYDYSNSVYCERIQQLGIEVLYGFGGRDRGRSWIVENGKYLDYVFMFRPEIATFYLESIRKNSKARVYYNLADLHYLRVMREYELTKDKKYLEESDKMKKEETELMKVCDKCVTVSSFEYDIISKIIGEEKTIIIPMYCYENYDIGERIQPVERSLMFVGGFSHRPNVDSVLYFINDIWPLIKKEISDVKLYIIGSQATKSILELASDDIIICGHVSDEELDEHYRAHSISIIPLRYGAGVKGKVIEAMYHKIPIVSTSIGLEGIEDISQMLLPKDTPEDFAEEVISLLDNHERRVKMGESYLDCIREHYSMDSMKELFSKEFELNQ